MVENQWLARQLLARGLASEAQIKEAFGKGGDLGETLVMTGVVKELDLLRLLSLRYKTQYITRTKLLAAKIPGWVLELIPKDFSLRYSVLPVRFDGQQAILSLLILDPSDEALLDAVRWEVQKRRPVRQVRPYVALASAIRNAIETFYGLPMEREVEGGESARAGEMKQTDDARSVPLRELGGDAGIPPELPPMPAPKPAPEAERVPVPQPGPSGLENMTLMGLGVDAMANMPPLPGPNEPTTELRQPKLKIPTIMGEDLPPEPSAPMVELPPLTELPPLNPPALKAPSAPTPPLNQSARVRRGELLASTRKEALEELISVGTVSPRRREADKSPAAPRAKRAGSGVSLSTLVRLTRVLVWEWEKHIGWRDEHSLLVARMCRKVGAQAGLPGHAVTSLKLAALLHELGQPSKYHLTALTVAENRSYKDLARQSLEQLSDLLTAVRLPLSIKRVLQNQFEQPCGQGVPGFSSGNQLSQEATILSVVDSYFDLLDNPGTPGGRCATKTEALARLRAAGERQRLCPLTVELLHQVVSPSAIRDRLLGEISTVLLVDPARDAHLGLVGALRSERAEVRAVIDPARAARVALTEAVDLVICELDLKPLDGLELIRRLRSDPRTQDLPVLLVVKSINDVQMDEARNLGVVDVMFKPYSTEECLAQILPVIAKRHSQHRELRRVSGALSELPLTELLRALIAGDKSGRLRVRLGRTDGFIRLDQGKVVEAVFGEYEGEDAFNEMLALTEGDFAVDPISLARERLGTNGNA